MKRKYTLIALVFTLVLSSGCAPWLRGKDDRVEYLQYASRQYLSSAYLKGSSWSILAVDLESNRILLNIDANRSLIAASGMKLLTTACALESLGPNFRIITEVGYTGNIDSAGALHGDLVILGAGDPTVSTRYSTLTDSADLNATLLSWADSISAHGIQSIDGNVTGYSGRFGGAPLGSGWEWDDLKHSYAAEVSPLVYADGFVDITVTPGAAPGAAAQVEASPDFDIIHLYSSVITSDSGTVAEIHMDRTLANNIISVWGNIPATSSPWQEEVAVYDAGSFFMRAFHQVLQEKGIVVNGQAQVSARTGKDGQSLTPLFTHASLPLSQLIRQINQDSQNLSAELLLRVLGDEIIASSPEYAVYTGDAFRGGRKKVLDWDASLPGSSTGLVIVDGSGLSRRNLISASGLVKVLIHMNRSAHRNTFRYSLATPGVGTLENRFLGLPRGTVLRAKTGSMARVRSLSGYLSTSGEPRIAFSIICNSYLCPSTEIDATIENICQLLALYMKGE
jgi:D-alanyl-D-alanine carboxypeptidase/D-alanyl-D-alanine-endopeptidase (penicillin-binding protein 4)